MDAAQLDDFLYYILSVTPGVLSQATPVWSLFGLGAQAFGNAIPSLPGAVGTFEAAFVGAITLVSGDQSTALAAALVAHFSNYLFTGIFGLIALSTEGETLMGIYRQLRNRQTSSGGISPATEGDLPKPAEDEEPNSHPAHDVPQDSSKGND